MPSRAKWFAVTIAAISLAATHDVAASPQCPNLSGNYMIQGEDGQVHIAIDQHDCDRISIVRKNNYLGTITSETHILKLDGKDQKDSPWFGSSEQYRTSAKFVGSELRVTARTYRWFDPHNDLRFDTGRRSDGRGPHRSPRRPGRGQTPEVNLLIDTPSC